MENLELWNGARTAAETAGTRRTLILYFNAHAHKSIKQKSGNFIVLYLAKYMLLCLVENLLTQKVVRPDHEIDANYAV